MQEDKISKWLAAELRKQQEENPLPYELGAWESFTAKRDAIARKKRTYWMSGIAAAVTVLLVAGGLWLAQETNDSGLPQLSDQITLQDSHSESISSDAEPSKQEPETAVASESPASAPVQEIAPDRESNLTPQSNRQSISNRRAQADARVDEQPVVEPGIALAEPKRTEALATVENSKIGEELIQSSGLEMMIATDEKAEGNTITPAEKNGETQALATLPKDPELSEEEIKEILERKSFAKVAMGLSPGFGASQGSDQATVGTSLGLGVMVDMEVTSKLVMGSGLAVNYLNQSSESQSYNSQAGAFNAASAVTETNEITQVQVDIPLYVKYPITRNRAISLQAGFSNLITFNQAAVQESSYTRQVAVLDVNSANSFTLRSEAVSQSQDLSVPNQKFYPLATANLGVNIRLFESKKTSYEVMPFYNYPLQEFSGYGEKLGMFGASFKVNFGVIQKK
ncbi:hypothetical protein J0A67_11310 [Algoriphagus aestuariicola]|uniref:Outer membrane protein beta-barrel domain-containing protein n=1 Tax=Algoriphagus aestuariicola TaxID=1852016 RepID=A0ABS3BQ82_9BACT|nr:hypothetical protein [Algoriphagus aestuariicola]MBN7801452.1 hypothetical protein [Algoriphagus aestuariicola]